jgi:hypothetical protein
MTILALGPGVSPGYQALSGNGVLDTTALTYATLGANTGVSFPNIPGLTLLLCKTVTGDPGASLTPGAQILGQSVGAIAFVEAVAAHVYILGPFFTLDANPAGGNVVQINFTTPANVSGLAVLQSGGVY